ncbi:MAG: ABC transporter substrate-binding protein [Candidatus Lustribacter sp.]|jgi:NitT/TauT family transport system substrate-binding protein
MNRLSRRSALALGLAATAAPLVARAQTLAPLRVAYQPYEYSAQVLYAREIGSFAKAGIDVTLQEIAYGSALATAVAAGAADIGIATITTLALAHSRNVPFVIVAPGAEFNAARKPTGFLMVGNQTGIKTAKDMAGRVVGTPGLATMGDYGVRYWVDANGGDSSTLKFQEMPFSQMPAAFATGRIDAAFIGEPYLEEAMKVAHPLAREMDALGKDYVITAWFATTSWAAAHPDLVARFGAALAEASAWAAKNPSKCIDILAKQFKVDPATIQPGNLATFPPKITPDLIAAEVQMTARYGKFPSFPPADLIYTPH